MSVTQKEIVQALMLKNSLMFRTLLANRIEREGILPPEGYAIVKKPDELQTALTNLHEYLLTAAKESP